MSDEYKSVPLETLGVLRVSGPDAVSFLQGQLSNDMTRLTAAHALLAGYHNPQGRVIALLRVLQLAPEELLAVLPGELIAPVARRLGRFILRAKVKLTDESAQWRIIGHTDCAASAAAKSVRGALPDEVNRVARRGAALAVCIAQQPSRWLLVEPVSEPALVPASSAGDTALWEHLAVTAGEPEVYAATSEAFVAQMLNLDALGAIAFEKGCYTGQEIIARAHYRGRVKRRMQRFLTADGSQLKPGDSAVLTDGRSFEVVRAVTRSDGRCEFLAVTALVGAPGGQELAASAGAASTPQGPEPLAAERLALPYPLPE